jgi:hypothetical protein
MFRHLSAYNQVVMKFAMPALCCLAASAQSPAKRDAVIALANAPTADAVKQMSTALEVVAGVQELVVRQSALVVQFERDAPMHWTPRSGCLT